MFACTVENAVEAQGLCKPVGFQLSPSVAQGCVQKVSGVSVKQSGV